MTLCERCRRRPAVIYRRLTRQKLCLVCYMDYTTRIVKRNMSSIRDMSPTTPIYVAIHPLMLVESLLLVHVVSRIEKRYGSKPHVMLLVSKEGEHGHLCRDLAKVLERHGIKYSSLVAVKAPLEKLFVNEVVGKPGFLRRLRGILSQAVQKLGGGVLVLPTCMEGLVSVEVSGYLRGIGFPLMEVRPGLSHPSIKGVVNGFYGIPCSEATLASILEFGVNGSEEPLYSILPKNLNFSDTVDEIAMRIVSDTVKEQSFEVLFSVQKSSTALAKPGTLVPCRVCGGPSKSVVCPWCEPVESLIRRIDVEKCEGF